MRNLFEDIDDYFQIISKRIPKIYQQSLGVAIADLFTKGNATEFPFYLLPIVHVYSIFQRILVLDDGCE